MRIRTISLTISFILFFTVACQQSKNNNNLLLALFVLSQSSCASGSDSYFSSQWNLENTGQSGGSSGEDANVKSVWSSGFCGKDIHIAIVSDGLDIDHEDLVDNIATGKSYNYSDASTDPGVAGNGMGTELAGIAAARSNDKGIRGVAPLASLRGYNLSQNRSTTNDADAMTRGISEVAIYANGWGPDEYGGEFQDSTSQWRSAIDTGLSSGRSGLGALYFFGSGNGDTQGSFSGIDNSNFNGYANYQGVMAICGVGDDGKRASFSEQGANLLLCGHSKGSDGAGIHTTDVAGSSGRNNGGSSSDYSDASYTKLSTGTEASMAEVAGVSALLLQVNSKLTWRDIRMILAKSARKNDSSDSDWSTNGAGMHINHKYGFGVVDAKAAMDLARSWTNLATQKTYQTSTSSPSATITDGSSTGVTSSLVVSGSGISSIEFVDVNVTFNHNYYRDLEMILTSPSGTKSILLARGTASGSPDGICVNLPGLTLKANGSCSYNGTWRFGVLRTLGESANGTWTLQVRDQGVRGTANGVFTSWNMKFYGY